MPEGCADAAVAVAAGDEIAADDLRRAGGVPITHQGTLAVEVFQGNVGGLEAKVSPIAQENLREISDEDLLRTEKALVVVILVELDRQFFAVDEEAARNLRDGVTRQHLVEPPLAEHANPEAVDGPGPLPLLDVVTAAFFHDDAADAVA
jgi:hypothetical protein